MDRKEVLELFNRRPRNCLLVTSDRKGKADIAVYGSPRMIGEETNVALFSLRDLAKPRRRRDKRARDTLSPQLQRCKGSGRRV